MSAELQVIQTWFGDQVVEEVMEAADYGAAYWGRDVVMLAKGDEEMPIVSGTYLRSIKTASPGYMTDDTAAARSADLSTQDIELIKRQVVDHQLAAGSWASYAYEIETGTAYMGARAIISEAGDEVSSNIEEYIQAGFEHVQRTI